MQVLEFGLRTASDHCWMNETVSRGRIGRAQKMKLSSELKVVGEVAETSETSETQPKDLHCVLQVEPKVVEVEWKADLEIARDSHGDWSSGRHVYLKRLDVEVLVDGAAESVQAGIAPEQEMEKSADGKASSADGQAEAMIAVGCHWHSFDRELCH